jgi:hypothetical protein
MLAIISHITQQICFQNNVNNYRQSTFLYMDTNNKRITTGKKYTRKRFEVQRKLREDT